MTCDCIDKVNALLAPKNTRLTEPLFVLHGIRRGPYLFVETEQIEKGRGKKKATSMFASHCPFCGEKYDTDPV